MGQLLFSDCYESGLKIVDQDNDYFYLQCKPPDGSIWKAKIPYRIYTLYQSVPSLITQLFMTHAEEVKRGDINEEI